MTNKNPRDYYAFVADLVQSKRQYKDDRWQIQDDLQEALNSLNEKYEADIAAPFTLTLGDECEGLLQHSAPIVDILWTLEMQFDLRIAVGKGEIHTSLDRPVGAIDGPAFHFARDLMTGELRRRKGGVGFRGFGADMDVPMTALGQTLSTQRRGWTKKQSAVASELRKEKTMTDVSIEWKQSVQNISRHAKNLDWELHVLVERGLKSLIDHTSESLPK